MKRTVFFINDSIIMLMTWECFRLNVCQWTGHTRQPVEGDQNAKLVPKCTSCLNFKNTSVKKFNHTKVTNAVHLSKIHNSCCLSINFQIKTWRQNIKKRKQSIKACVYLLTPAIFPFFSTICLFAWHVNLICKLLTLI